MCFQNCKNKILICLCFFFCTTVVIGLQAQEGIDVSDSINDEVRVVQKSASVSSKDERVITGVVIDATTKLPIVTAELSADKYASSIVSDKGAFSLRIPYATTQISVVADGYQAKVVSVKGNSHLTISLISDQNASFFEKREFPIGEIIKSNFPFSSSHSKKSYPLTEKSLEEYLQTEVGEMRTVLRSGFSGIGGNMFIRGFNTINGFSQPLIVVDGIPYETLLDKGSLLNGLYTNPLTNIDLEDIDNISVIKDGYSHYGVKGANGVIVITTRRAKEQTSKINVSASWGVNMAPKQIPMLNAKNYRVFATEQMRGANYSVQDILDQPYLNDDRLSSEYATYHNNTNWQDEIMQNGLVQNYHAGITGGDEIAKYAISMGYMNVENSIKDSYLDRFNFRFNSDIDLSKDLQLLIGVAFSQTNRDTRDQGVIQRSSPYFLSLVKSPLVAPYLQSYDGTRLSELSDVDIWGVSNPNAIIKDGMGDNSQYRLNLYGKLNYALNTDWLFNGTFSYDRNKLKEKYFLPQYGMAPEYIEETESVSKNHAASLTSGYIGVYGSLSANYRKTLNYIHDINANGGVRFQNNSYQAEGGEGDNSSSIYLTDNMVNQIFLYNKDNWKWASAFVDVDYTLKSRYSAWLSLSGDGSSRAGKDERYGVFPSLGTAWRISGEEFMKKATILDLLQIRANWGVTGNDYAMNIVTKDYFASIPYQQMNGLSFQNLRNDKLKWETTVKSNLGLDLGIWDERLMLSVDVYRSMTKDLITYQTLDASSSFKGMFLNGGELENKGVELKLGMRLVDTRDFKWSTQVTFSKYKNKLTSLPENNKDILSTYSGATILSRVGLPVGVFYGYKTEGVFSTAKEAKDADLHTYLSNRYLYTFEAGDMCFQDVNDDHFIDEKDMQVIGDPNPDFFGTIGLNFTYKSLSLDVVFSGVYGNDVYNHLRAQTEAMSSFNNQAQSILNRWKAENQITDMPRASYGDPRGNARFSDRWIEDGSYLRLKNLTLTWKSPKKLFFLDGFTLFASASNVFVITKYLGADPEFSTSNKTLFQGIDSGNLPQSRSFMAGFKLNL